MTRFEKYREDNHSSLASRSQPKNITRKRWNSGKMRFSASTISAINQRLDEELERFMCRWLEKEYPYVILDAR